MANARASRFFENFTVLGDAVSAPVGCLPNSEEGERGSSRRFTFHPIHRRRLCNGEDCTLEGARFDLVPGAPRTARMQRRNSMLLDRFQVGQDRCDFIMLEEEFWHVGVADGDPLCQ